MNSGLFRFLEIRIWIDRWIFGDCDEYCFIIILCLVFELLYVNFIVIKKKIVLISFFFGYFMVMYM